MKQRDAPLTFEVIGRCEPGYCFEEVSASKSAVPLFRQAPQTDLLPTEKHARIISAFAMQSQFGFIIYWNASECALGYSESVAILVISPVNIDLQ